MILTNKIKTSLREIKKRYSRHTKLLQSWKKKGVWWEQTPILPHKTSLICSQIYKQKKHGSKKVKAVLLERLKLKKTTIVSLLFPLHFPYFLFLSFSRILPLFFSFLNSFSLWNVAMKLWKVYFGKWVVLALYKGWKLYYKKEESSLP